MNNGEKKDRRGGARPGAGRPRVIKDNFHLLIIVSGSIHNRLKSFTDRHGISYRVFIERALDMMEKSDPR